MWNKHPLEEILRIALIKQFGEEIGPVQFGKYTSARDYLVDTVYEEIKGTEPSLTDHGPKHIYNVLSNVKDLLEDEVDQLTGMELYCLCLMVLFHDVGNISGRKSHNKKIAEIYNDVRKKDAKFNQERKVIIKGAEAHCGTTKAGDRDTLLSVEEVENIEGCKIRLRELAAILRFADELAEGPQRTSSFMIATGRYSQDSEIFHKYASITNVFIDKGNNRIVLSYHLDIVKDDLNDSSKLVEFINFMFERINKLDEERRYNKYYTPLLTQFKKTEISINLSFNGLPIEDIDHIKIMLTDKYPIPGETQDTGEEILSKICSDFKITEIIDKIKAYEAADEKSI